MDEKVAKTPRPHMLDADEVAELLKYHLKQLGLTRVYLKTQTSYKNCTKSKNTVE